LAPETASPSIEVVARLMLFVRRPEMLSNEEAVLWMREQATALARGAAIERVELVRLRSPALRGHGDCEWLIEMHCAGGDDACRAACEDPCRELIADLRLLGMRPRLVLADRGEPIKG
jgi:hypothetical protein